MVLGTDPSEGANIAISILLKLYNNGILTMCTTHYPELKTFAMQTVGFENACSEFDIENLKPTFRLLIGVPGQSNAFAISEKLGLDADILAYAKSISNTNQISIEDLLRQIYNDKKAIEIEKEKIVKNSKEIDDLKYDLYDEKRNLEQLKQSYISTAKEEARQILISAKEQADKMINSLENGVSKSDANSIRKKIKQGIVQLAPNYNFSESHIEKKDISIGLSVFVKPLNTYGTILSLPDKSDKVQVQVGSTKTYFPISDIEKSNIKIAHEGGKVKSKLSSKSSFISPEINLLGYRVEDATSVLDKYLDDCVMSKLSSIRIIHGKGSGALRSGIHAFLKTNPHVKNFRLGSLGEGEMGVTIVELK